MERKKHNIFISLMATVPSVEVMTTTACVTEIILMRSLTVSGNHR